MLSSTFDAKYKQVGATKRGSYSDMLFLVTESVLTKLLLQNEYDHKTQGPSIAKQYFHTFKFWILRGKYRHNSILFRRLESAMNKTSDKIRILVSS